MVELITREDKIRHGLSKEMRILEIGPSYNPLVPKSDGYGVYIVDHMTRGDLVEKYTGHHGVDVTRIEEVDFVWQGQPLDELIPNEMLGTFDACISSHVIEHTPDFAGFFVAASKLLKPNGTIRMAVPDKRFCFDWFRPHSTTGQILEAYRNPSSRHRLAAHYDHVAYACSNSGAIAWGQGPVGDIVPLTANLEHAYQHFNAQPSPQYADCHGWQFTPSSFELIIFELSALGLIDFHVERIFPVSGCEFIVRLHKSSIRMTDGSEVSARRLELLKRIVEELGVQADCLRASRKLADPVNNGAPYPIEMPPKPSLGLKLRSFTRHPLSSSRRKEFRRRYSET